LWIINAIGDEADRTHVTSHHVGLADNYSQLGDATMEVLSSKYRLGDGQRIDNRERHQALDEEMQVFGVLTDDVRLSMRRQVKAETFYFMDLVQEYKGMLQGLKVFCCSGFQTTMVVFI
jgi:hypothetical protein